MQRERLAVLIITVSLVAMALVGVAVVSPIGASQPADSADRTITVSAFGEADAAPDRATIRVAVTSTGDDPAAVRDDLVTGADSLRDGLESIGLTDEDYETTEYRITEERRFPEEERGEPTYRGVHAFEVTLEDPDRTGEVIDVAANSGAEIGNIEFTLSDELRDELREEAIESAMNDARTQANAIATNGELHVTGVQNVDATQRQFSPVHYEFAAADGAAESATTIDTGDVSVRYDVQVTYNATAGTQ